MNVIIKFNFDFLSSLVQCCRPLSFCLSFFVALHLTIVLLNKLMVQILDILLIFQLKFNKNDQKSQSIRFSKNYVKLLALFKKISDSYYIIFWRLHQNLIIHSMHQDSDEENNSISEQMLIKLAPEQPTPSRRKTQKLDEPEPLVKAINLNVIRQKKPRLIIDYMVLEDFKSYAGRQIIGKFHANFTSVVGPNGSGKSNLIESMLFIFGFNASWMRLNKLNQLIHNSSTSTGNAKAAVEVHFKKLQDTANGTVIQVEGSNFWIRRTVNSSSISKYFICGRESTQAEVKQRLKSEGIDLGNNRFLILQGEVQQISQMKQKSGDSQKPGLLEYLQDIIGSNQYIEKIQQCVKEYALAQQQKHEKGQLMKLVEAQLKGMSKAKDEAVKYVKKQKKIFQIKNIFNQVIVCLVKQQLKKLEVQQIQLQKIKDKILGQERQKLRKQVQRLKQIKKNKLEIEENQRQAQRYQEACSKLQADDKHITQEIKFKSEDIVKFQRKRNEADTQISKIINQCDELKSKMPQQKRLIDQKSNTLEQMRSELSKYDRPELKQKIKECQVQTSKNDLQLNTIKNKLESIRQNVQKMKVGKDELQKKLSEYKEKLTMNTQVKEKIGKALRGADKMVRERKQVVSGLSQKRDNLKNELRKCQNELREQLNQTQEKGQMGNMFREIMQQNIPGVIGRLGDLGQVSRQYDEIITTCCFRLDNIVCTDVDSGKAVVEFLKRKRLGRATCIILQRLGDSRHYMNKPFQNLPRATRLFDVIKFKTEEAKLAFYNVLGDTLYCEDSDLGMEYSMKNEHQRRRVISKNKNRNGFIIYQTNGLMVGSAPKRGGFETKAGIKNKKTKDQSYLKQMYQKKKQLGLQLDDIMKKITTQQDSIKKTFIDMQQMKRELSSTQNEIKQFQEEIKDITQMISKNQGKNNSHHLLQKQIEALLEAQRNLNVKKKQIQKQMQKYQMEQRKNQTPQINVLRENYKALRAEVLKLEKQNQKQKALIQTGLKRINDLKKSKVDNEKFLERVRKQIDKLKNDQLALENQVADILGKIAALQQKIKDSKKVQNDLKHISQQQEKELRESRVKVQKVKKDVQNCIQNLKKQSMDLKFAETQLQRVRQNYRELSQTYSFFQEIDQIQKINIGGDKNIMSQQYEGLNSSILQTSMLNSSIDSNQPKNFPIQRLLKTNPLQNLSEDLLQTFSYYKDKLSGMITSQTAALKKIQGSNLQIINQFKNKYTQYRERLRQFDAVRQRQIELKKIIDHLKQQRLNLFRQGFGVINAKLKEVYQHLTRGGDAELQLIDSLDPFSDGVNFSVRPPKKSWKQVNKLSGGQKTLSSLSLIFALHYYKPTPLYFMDEIDAALDFKNVSIVADYIKKRTKDAQFIIISLRNNMFDLADKLIGVYKTFDKTKVINLQPNKLKKAKEQKTERQKQNMEEKSNRPNSFV